MERQDARNLDEEAFKAVGLSDRKLAVFVGPDGEANAVKHGDDDEEKHVHRPQDGAALRWKDHVLLDVLFQVAQDSKSEEIFFEDRCSLVRELFLELDQVFILAE